MKKRKFWNQKKIIFLIFLIIPNPIFSVSSSKTIKISYKDIETFVLNRQEMVLNNFNVIEEDAFFGGRKLTVQLAIKNTVNFPINYTIYMGFFTKKNDLIACFEIEPGINIHEQKKIEVIDKSGIVDSGDVHKIDYVLIRIVNQNTDLEKIQTIQKE